MRVKGIIAEDFINYRLPAMFIASVQCDFKCCTEGGLPIETCQNAPLAADPIVDIPDEDIYSMFAGNDISKAVVIGGLEPLCQFDEVNRLIATFRGHGETCDFVIYTGYYPEEVANEVNALSEYSNIVVKFGRFIPNDTPAYDEVLGVTLASGNQYARRIS